MRLQDIKTFVAAFYVRVYSEIIEYLLSLNQCIALYKALSYSVRMVKRPFSSYIAEDNRYK